MDAASQAERAKVLRRQPTPHHREHHVTKDYSYVHKDLIAVAVVSTVALAFIVGMSFLV